MDQYYINLTKHIHHLVLEELKTGNYPHLRGNKRKTKLGQKNEFDMTAERYRINFLFRQGLPTGNKQRNLTGGRTEILFEYRGAPQENIFAGYNLQEEDPVRIKLGEYLPHEMIIPLLFAHQDRQMYSTLKTGNYELFVRKSLIETNNIITEYKNIIKRNPQEFIEEYS